MIDRIFDCKNDIKKYIQDILVQYHLHHHLHIINTGLSSKEDLLNILPLLGFNKERLFVDGGRASSNTQDKWVVKDVLRNMDYYPKQHYLLPNTEIQYSKSFPEDVLLYVEQSTNDGKIFLHRICDIENILKSSNDGQLLYDKIKKHGLKIFNGFLDENDIHKKDNFMKSWQELTGLSDIDEAVNLLRKEYFYVCKKDTTILCVSLIDGFKIFNNKEYINLPRIAMTEPSPINGFREFTFGNNDRLSKQEIDLLLEAYYDTQIGGVMNNNDIYLFNNITVAHSRETYTDDDRKILVSMAGKYEENIISSLPKIEHPISSNSDTRYTSPSVEHQINEGFSSMIYDLNNQEFTDITINKVNKYYDRYGYLQIINTPYKDSIPEEILNKIGFSFDKQFRWGGKDSGRTIRYSKGNGFHSVDKYPANLMLLPHQEIFYQRILPKNMLFHYRKTTNIGGRTLIHSGIRLLEMIKKENIQLYNKMLYGQSIITGFLDENHHLKNENFVRSWQDRFGTDNMDEALVVCKNQTTHFDECWKEDSMLMTKITIPLFKEYLNELYMMFPRIAYDKPSLINGNRRFILGNGEEFTNEEIDLLLKCFYYTREGINQKSGDILLVNNIRFGHSREPYIEGDIRDVAVIMSEEFIADYEIHKK